MTSSTGCRAELRRLAKHKGLITHQEFHTLREQRRCAEARERRMRGEAIRPDYAGD